VVRVLIPTFERNAGIGAPSAHAALPASKTNMAISTGTFDVFCDDEG
jgi:hypothetical protein